MIELTQSEGFWYSPDLGRTLTRIVGGLSLPTSEPGAAVVVGEEMKRSPEPVKFFVLAETENFNTDDLLRWCEFGNSVPLEWFLSQANQTGHNIVHGFNERQVQRQRPTVSIVGAPVSKTDNIVWHLNVIRQNQGRIIFPEGSVIQAKIETLEEDQSDSFRESKNPAAAALGFCIGYLTAIPYQAEEEEEAFCPDRHGVDPVTGY